MAELQHEMSVISVPEVKRQRYRYEYDVRHSTTCNVGEILPFYVNPLVNPGDTFSIGVNLFLSLNTSLFATQDQLAADIYFFQDRNINLMKNWKRFWGENNKGSWAVESEMYQPQIIIKPTDEINARSILNRFGVPQMKGDGTRTKNIQVPLLPYVMMVRTYNEWLRDQNYIEPIDEDALLGDEDINYSDLPRKDMFIASRHHDIYYCIPEPRKGNSPTIPVGTSAPVIGNGNALGILPKTGIGQDGSIGYLQSQANENASSNSTAYYGGKINYNTLGVTTDTTKSGLITDLTQAVGAQLDEQRYVVGINHIFETMALYGSRYREMLRGSFGVISSSELNNIPEFLGAQHIPLDMTTVLQTSANSGEDYLGGTAGFSNTIADIESIFTKSFDVHSCILGVCIIRQQHSYCQGLPLWALKSRKYDYYNPELEGLSNVGMPKKAIMVTGTSTDEEIWGYHGIYNEYRCEPNYVSGFLAPNSVNSAGNTNIANYMYTDYYENVPVLGQEWLEETTEFVDRTLQVKTTKCDQFRCDFVTHVIKLTEVPRLELPGIDKL